MDDWLVDSSTEVVIAIGNNPSNFERKKLASYQKLMFIIKKNKTIGIILIFLGSKGTSAGIILSMPQILRNLFIFISHVVPITGKIAY